jgi:hypothetical protein
MQKKQNLINSLIFSKILVNLSFSLADPTHFASAIGRRKSLFSILNPAFLQSSLKTALLFLESFIKNKYELIFITDIKEPLLFICFRKVCKKHNHFLYKSSEVLPGFLTNNKVNKNVVVISLFLSAQKTQAIQKETLSLQVPLISFSDLSINKNSSSFYVAGSYNSFLSQNLILNLLTVSLEQKYDYS